MKRIIYTTIVFCMIAVAAHAQRKTLITLDYTPSMTLGSAREFIEPFSWSGITLDYKFFVKEHYALGFNAGWNFYYQAKDEPVTEKFQVNNAEVTITGKQFRYINAIPLLITGTYYKESKSADFYASLGVGALYSNQRKEMGLYAAIGNNWQFAVSPMVGTYVPLSYNTTMHLGLQYNYCLAADDYINVSYLAFKVGFAWIK